MANERDAETRGWACAPPGSPEAVGQHCSCPVIDNGRGRGTWGTAGLPAEERVYVVNADCPLHGTAAAVLIIPAGGDATIPEEILGGGE